MRTEENIWQVLSFLEKVGRIPCHEGCCCTDSQSWHSSHIVKLLTWHFCFRNQRGGVLRED